MTKPQKAILGWSATITGLICFGIMGYTIHDGLPPPLPPQSPQQFEDSQPSPPKHARKPRTKAEAMVRVMVYDDTQSRPLHNKCEIWFRGHGSWWLKSETKFGSAARNLGLRQIGHRDSIVLYPDGRGAQEILIPFTMTTAMNPNGSVRDSIFITIGDHEIEVVGLPLKAATGDSTMRIERDG